MIPLEMYRAGRSYAEIGAALGLSMGQVARAVYVARPRDDLAVPAALRGKEFMAGDLQSHTGGTKRETNGLVQRLHKAGAINFVRKHRTGSSIWRAS